MKEGKKECVYLDGECAHGSIKVDFRRGIWAGHHSTFSSSAPVHRCTCLGFLHLEDNKPAHSEQGWKIGPESNPPPFIM